jgi:hypothetical protein
MYIAGISMMAVGGLTAHSLIEAILLGARMLGRG